MPKGTAPDRWLLLVIGLLAIWGLFMVGSASHYVAMTLGKSSYYYLLRQGIYAVAAGLVLYGMMRMPYRKLDDPWLVWGLVAASIVALGVVLFMPPAGGARRWFPLGFASVQPSELAKLVVILFMARLLARNEKEVNTLWTVPAPAIAVTGSMAALIAVEPDLGAALMVAALMGVMLFVAGLRWSYIGAVAGTGLVGSAVAILIEPYRIERIKAFLDPTADLKGDGFQLWQSLIAQGTGGWIGVGLGEGQQKGLYLPAAHTDFIFSVVGEEMGLVGTCLMLVAFVLLFWRGIRAARRAPDTFGAYLALGATCLLTIQALVHMAVCIGLVPTKGLPLPFISYGGSSLVACGAAAGLLLNVSQHSS